jgi:beta-glucanase (GH16 family)
MSDSKVLTNLLFTGLIVSAVVYTLISYRHAEEQAMVKPVYPANNLNEDSYELGPDWQLVWADEFDGEEIDPDNWNFQVLPAGQFNKEWQRYTDSSQNAYIEHSNLVIRAVHESDSHGLDQYTSARLNTAGKQSWKHGRVAARIQMPYGKGLWPAFWMLGANIDENGGDTPWPLSGEIDIMEFYGSKDNGAVEVNMHYADTNGKHAQMGAATYELEQGNFADNFHIFEMEWDAEKIVWYVDGKEVARNSLAEEVYNEFHQPFFILLNIAVGGEWAGRPDDSTPFPQFMYIDWVRVYQKS